MERQQQQKKGKGFFASRIAETKRWMQPDPADNVVVQGLKLIFKSIAVLFMYVVSPALLIILSLVFLLAI